MTDTDTTTRTRGHAGPPLWPLATISLLLFLAGIVCSAALTGSAPTSPWNSAHTIQRYLDHEHAPVALALLGFFTFGSSIPLGLYTATIHSRLHYLGIRAAGATIALYGGLGASFMLALSGLSSWVLSRAEVRGNLPVARAVSDFAYVTGGPGLTVLLGLLIAGVAVPVLITRLVPRPLAWTGLVIAVLAELSHFSLIWYGATFLIPIGRFAGLLWLIAVGALLPRARQRRNA
jgi:hypothetical protein